MSDIKTLVTATDLARRPRKTLMAATLSGVVGITHHGRLRFLMMTVADYESRLGKADVSIAPSEAKAKEAGGA